jgi:hypothetical protein
MARKTGIFLLLLACTVPAASAAPGPPARLNKQELQPRTCGKGRVGGDVVPRGVNAVDSGTKGNFWAFDDYTRSIKVWRVGDRNFCTIVTYTGVFRTIAGVSPGGSGTISAGVTGRFEGGYRMDFGGTLRPRPNRRMHGAIGTINYGCDASGNCPGSVYWVTLYFSNVTGDDFDWWGWLYKAGKHGSWLNAVDGAKGDIVSSTDGKGKKKR